MQKTNKVVRISYSGGLLGLIFGSTRGKLEKTLEQYNRAGWNLAEVVADNPNLIIWVIRLILLIVTLGLWTLSTGYLLILERPVDYVAEKISNTKNASADRTEPILSARRN